MDLLQNPFHILNASLRDNRRRIMELADERSLFLDSSECIEARSDLTNPRKRLSIEIAWLPGVGLKRTEELLSLLESSPKDLLTVDKVPSIARANLLAAGLTRLSNHELNEVGEWILEIAQAFEDIDPEEVRILINEERVVSGFPEVMDYSAVEAEIQERRRHYRKVIKSALDNLPKKERVEVMTVVIDTVTNDGDEHGPVLIADLIDLYEVETQEFLEKKEGDIRALVEKLRAAVDAEQPDSTLAPMVNQLIQIVKNWDIIAQPIQVSMKSRGLDHDASHRIADLVRGLSLHMFNKHGKIDFAQQLTNMLQEVFAEVGKVAERIDEDVDALGAIAERRKLSQLLNPISDLCKRALESSNRQPTSADREALQVMNTAPQLISNLSAAKPSAEILSQVKDEIAITLMHCAVVYSNKTGKWESCTTFLEEALKYASSQEVKSRIQKYLTIVRPKVKTERYKNLGGILLVLFVILMVVIFNYCDGNNREYTLTEEAAVEEEVVVDDAAAVEEEVVTDDTAAVEEEVATDDVALQYAKPPIGTNNILSESEIRWCIREQIRIEAMEQFIDTYAEIDEFNRTVGDYNSRCGSFRYSNNSLSKAEQGVEPYRSQIVEEAIREVK